MGKVGIGLNLEAVRTSHKSFELGAEFAAKLGYEYIEPMVHWGRELLSEARYFQQRLDARRPAAHPPRV